MVAGSRTSGRAAAALLAASAALIAAPGDAGATARIGSATIVVRGSGGSAVIDRSPFRLSFRARGGRRVLSEAAGGAHSLVVPPTTQNEFGLQGPPGPALYAPLGFLVGTHSVAQSPSGQWQGTLQSVTEGGAAYSATSVVSAKPAGAGVRLVLATSDPSGRRLVATVKPFRAGTIRVSARVTPSGGVAAMSDSFSSPPSEAFHGFGGRHDTLDQRGNEFYNYLQQENFGSGSTDNLTTPTVGSTYLFPNGPSAAYYVQSSFDSSAGYGFLLDRDEISHWRLDSDRPNAWQTEVAAPAIDYVVAPGGPRVAIRKLTAITGRQPAPPRWAVGPAFDREVLFPSDPPGQYAAEVRADLRDIRRYHLPLDAYRLEGWAQLSRPVLKDLIDRIRRMGIHPMVYFRSFVGVDPTGTDTPHAYDVALAKGYVATHADGSPYVFTSNFFRDAAQIDFTNPAAVRWWKHRVRRALNLGADGFMQDFGEQVFDDMHFHDGSTGATMHNRLPLLYDRTTRQVVDAYERRHPNRHIFFFTRSGYTGTPGSAAYEGGNFPGDETTDWTRSSGLASLTTDMLNRAIGGAYGYTTDIGGYFDVGPYPATTKELFLRWAEWAALSPLFRLHGSVLHGVHAPWTYDASTVKAYNRLSRLHLRARPLILRLWRRADRTGMPITRPLWLAAPNDPRAAAQDQEWMLGPNVLVAPVVVEGARSRSVYFPPGCWRKPSGGPRIQGRRSLEVAAPLERLPYFFRCGTRPFQAPMTP